MKTLVSLFLLMISVNIKAEEDRNQFKYNYLFKDGIFSPVYGEAGAQITNEYGSRNGISNAQFGIQALRIGEQSLSVGYVVRGFGRAHIGPGDYTLRLDGPELEYMWDLPYVRPIIMVNYLTGEQRRTYNQTTALVDVFQQTEVQVSAAIQIPAINGSLVVGYNRAFTTTAQQTEEYCCETTVKNKNRKTQTSGKTLVNQLTPGKNSTYGSLVVGFRFSSF